MTNNFIKTITHALIATASSSMAAITFTQDLDTPASASFSNYTKTAGVANADQSRSVRSSRSVGQTFQLSQAINVSNIWFNYSSNDTVSRTFTLSIYAINNVNTTDISTASPNPIYSRAITADFAKNLTGTAFFSLSLTETDAFSLAQRDTGSEGYALEIVADSSGTTQWNGRGLNTSPYPNGRAFNETGLATGTASIASGDWNFAINALPEPSAAVLGAIGSLILLRRRRA